MSVFGNCVCISVHLASDRYLTSEDVGVGVPAFRTAAPKPVDGLLGLVDGDLLLGQAYLFVERGVRREVDDVLGAGVAMLGEGGGLLCV